MYYNIIAINININYIQYVIMLFMLGMNIA